MNYTDINKKAYEETAEEYLGRISWYEDSDRKIVDPFINLVQKRFERPKVLELGPGSGLSLRFFEEHGFETSAIDFSKKILEIAMKTSPKTEFFEGDFLKYEFGNRKFEGIFAKAFIHLFPRVDAERVIDKVFCLLNEKGLFYVSTTIHSEPGEGFFRKEDYEKKSVRFRKKWTGAELISLLEKKGFVLEYIARTEEEALGKKWIVLILSKKNL